MGTIEKIANEFFQTTGSSFPVVSASDEFYYFPQVQSEPKNWYCWDRFSKEFIIDFSSKLSQWENQLLQITCATHEEIIDQQTLIQSIVTLREYLTEIKAWQKQPSLYLSIACIGMAETFTAQDKEARFCRAKTLPSFFTDAIQNLKTVPFIFQEIGIQMIQDVRHYFLGLMKSIPDMKNTLMALDCFESHIKQLPVLDKFLLPQSLIHRVVNFHMNYQMDIQDVIQLVDHEIERNTTLLKKESYQFAKTYNWQEAYEHIPFPNIAQSGLIQFYQTEIKRLESHCIQNGFISNELANQSPVTVKPVPDYLSAIRTASSYSISPLHPPCGGHFYIIRADDPNETKQGYHREYKQLSAHETYPGHHLLDTMRWQLVKPIRRPIERPVFYEGWACFSESLMEITGYYDTPYDRLILARRRLWRAIRGKIDVELQTGKIDLLEAANKLSQTGIPKTEAIQIVKKYALNPAYQLCYTIGYCQIMKLFETHGYQTIKPFVSQVLSQGEICFSLSRF